MKKKSRIKAIIRLFKMSVDQLKSSQSNFGVHLLLANC